jgi:hypothetical protein
MELGNEAGRNVLLRDGELRINLISMTSSCKAVIYEKRQVIKWYTFQTLLSSEIKITILSHRLHLVPSFCGHLHPLHLPSNSPRTPLAAYSLICNLTCIGTVLPPWQLP